MESFICGWVITIWFGCELYLVKETSVGLSFVTKARLKGLKLEGESFEDVIVRLMDGAKTK